MRLTPKAVSLRASLKSLLANVTDLVDPPNASLVDIRQTLRISMADYPALFVIGPLLENLQVTAPGIDLVIQPWHGADAAKAALVDGTTDIAISVFPDADDDIQREELLSEHYVVAMREGHPVADNFDLKSWLSFPHILVSGRGDQRSPVDAQLAKLGYSRRIGLVVPTFQMVPDLLRMSDMVAMLPSRVVQVSGELRTSATPIPVDGFTLHLAWHRRRTNDAGLQHVAKLLNDLLQ